jgi:hypothetical protein
MNPYFHKFHRSFFSSTAKKLIIQTKNRNSSTSFNQSGHFILSFNFHPACSNTFISLFSKQNSSRFFSNSANPNNSNSATASANNKPAEESRSNTENAPEGDANAASPEISSTRRAVEAILTALFLYFAYRGYEWLSYWPEPLQFILDIAQLDPLVQTQIGEAVSASYFWTGNIREGDLASVVIPISGSKGKGSIYARAMLNGKSKEWKLIYLHASIEPRAQRYTLFVPSQYQFPTSPINPNPYAATATSNKQSLVLPANFDPNQLSAAEFESYQQFLTQNKLTEFVPEDEFKEKTVEIAKNLADQAAAEAAATTQHNNNAKQ